MTPLHSKILLVLLCQLIWSATANAAEFFVSPNGNDANPGTRELPFSSIEKAIRRAEIVFQESPDEDCIIWLNGNTFYLEEPIILDAEKLRQDSGNLYFRAIPGENPVISGGVLITEWEELPGGLWKTKLHEHPDRRINPRELFVGNQRAVRARYPNEGYLRIMKAGDDRRTHFFFESGDFPIPEKVQNVELVLLHDWSISRITVKEIDGAENKLTAVDSIGAKEPDFFNLDHWEPNPRYYLENAMEFLDAEYEWFFDADERAFYLKLPQKSDPNMLRITVPVSEGLVRLIGKENRPLKNIHFEGIRFRHASWQIPESGYCGVQACHYDPRPARGGWAVVPAAIQGEWALNCSFTDCAFEHLGGSGLWLGTGSSNCTIKNSRFADISGNGIMIGEGQSREVNGKKWWESVPEQVALGNTIENCTITECGRQFYGAVGIWCGLTAQTAIRNNTIYNLPYTGISIGWMWSPVPTPCRENIISGNHIHHIMQALSDGGGIYMLGLQPGSKIIGNHIHDVSLNVGRAESNGMFLDEGTTDVEVANNLIYKITKSPLRFHRATTNLVKENVLFCGEGVAPVRYNNTKEEDIQQVDNKVFSEADENFEERLKYFISQWENQR